MIESLKEEKDEDSDDEWDGVVANYKDEEDEYD